MLMWCWVISPFYDSKSDICCFRCMAWPLLHFVLNWRFFTLIFAVLLTKQNSKYYGTIRSLRPLGVIGVGAFNGATFELMRIPCCCIKFEVYNFIRSRDIKEIPIFKNRSHNLVHASTWPNFFTFCIVPLAVSICTKFEVRKFSRSIDVVGVQKL